MTPTEVILLIAGIFLVQGVIWLMILTWLKHKTRLLAQDMLEQCRIEGKRIIMEPQAALFRGSDSEFGNIKCNGVLCLTDSNLMFEKVVGQRIEIGRDEIAGASVQDTFKGKTYVGIGRKHLVLRTRNNNRIGFLMKNAKEWVERLGYPSS